MMPLSLSPSAPDPGAAGLSALASIVLANEQDVVVARQTAKKVSQALGFDLQDQVRVSTAASEIAREGLQSGERPLLTLGVDGPGTQLLIRLEFPPRSPQTAGGPSRPSGDFALREGMIAARRVMSHFRQLAEEGGTIWEFGRALATARSGDRAALAALSQALAVAPENLDDEFQSQSQELLAALQDVRRCEAELAHANRELEETNRGVVALYAELEEQAQALKRTNEQKTRFYSSVSHEFRTPVTSILSLSQILLDRLDGELTAEQERQISLIRRCGQNLLEWVNDLLDLARADSGRMDLRFSDFTVHDLLTSLRGIMRPLVTTDLVNLVFDDPGELGKVVLHSDEGKLSQVLRNFISNALKFTERGEVRVRVDRSETVESDICFTVRDTGIGIAPGDVERIFDEFVQIDNSLQRKARGTGLGLPLSRRLAGLLGGSIEVSSTPGEGSLFRLIVPRSIDERGPAPADSQGAADTAANVGTSGTPLVLVVDDDEASRYLLKQALAKLSLEVRDASDGFEGLSLAEELAPRAIFLDLVMPGLGGVEVLESLQQSTRTRGIPVLLYTSQREPCVPAHLNDRVFAVLHKPTSEDGVPLKQIRDHLERAGVLQCAPSGATP